MMQGLIRELCVLSILCGAALSLAPEGTARKAMQFVCSVVLLACVMGGLGRLDLSQYAVSLSLHREREQQFLLQAEEDRDALNRLVLEREYAAYGIDLARSLGVAVREFRVQVRWDTEGVWVPDAVTIVGSFTPESRGSLSRRITADLGVPADRQEWIEDA